MHFLPLVMPARVRVCCELLHAPTPCLGFFFLFWHSPPHSSLSLSLSPLAAYAIQTTGVPFADKVLARSWHYYYFDLDPTVAGAPNDLIIALNVTAGDPDL